VYLILLPPFLPKPNIIKPNIIDGGTERINLQNVIG
ncbi:unnamed protein product, partial [marine sediment metagenome]